MAFYPFSGFLQRLAQDQLIRSDQVITIIEEVESQSVDIIQFLVEHWQVSATSLASHLAQQLALPLLDLAAVDTQLLALDRIDEQIIRKHLILPLSVQGSTLFIVTSNPFLQQLFDDIQSHTKLRVELIIVEYPKLKQCIEQLYANVHFLHSSNNEEIDLELELLPEQPLSTDESDEPQDATPIIKYVNKLLIDAIRMGASDLHFEPYEHQYRVRYRIDGLLRHIATPPLQLAQRISSRLKVMSQLDIAEKRLPQDGRMKLKVSAHKSIDFRVSTLPTLYGEKLVLRILNASQRVLDIDQLGLESHQKQLFLDEIHQPHGMILITGPTGSGKTVSLYTALSLLNDEQRNISTVEDPVEIYLEGVNQMNINPKIGLDFSTALRSFLRQDPDVLMVGEIRDADTADIAIKAAQTGHKVLSTVHTNSAIESIQRLKNLGVATFNIATSLHLVIAQRLARCLCSACKEEITIPKESLMQLGFLEQDFSRPFKIYQAAGCAECQEGYKGRIGIYEVLKISPEIAQAIMQEQPQSTLLDLAQQHGFISLRRAGLLKVMQGITSLQEVNRIINL